MGTAPGGKVYNVQWGGKYFLVQENWVPSASGGYCAMQ
jgi:hypothetical protein